MVECVAKRAEKVFFPAHSSLRRPHYLNAWNRLFGLCYELLPNEHGAGRRDEALRKYAWEARASDGYDS